MVLQAQKVRAPRRSKDSPVEYLQIRVGIHVGPITSGVLGKDLPRFDVFGHAVNMAARSVLSLSLSHLCGCSSVSGRPATLAWT